MNQRTGDNFNSPVLLLCWDLTNREAQPEPDVDGAAPWHPPSSEDWVWTAGYIANRSELLNQLAGHEAIDDRQIVYHLYCRQGIRATTSIAGTLAWVLWDSQRRELILTRDRIGNHNFYFATLNGKLWVTNRLETLLELEIFPRTPNPRSVVAHITGHAPLVGETFYDTIRELAPGSWMRIQGHKPETGRYWQIEAQPVLKLASDEDYARALWELLFRLAAECAPAGQAYITLSGGIDSTSLAAAIRHTAPNTSLSAFCWSAPELPEADESSDSAEVCRFLDIPSEEIRADLLWPLSRPDGIHTPATMPFYAYYSELIDETFKRLQGRSSNILLTGMSGDHLFGGNVFAYPDLLLSGRWAELTRQMRYHLPRSATGLSLFQIIRRMILTPIREAYLPGWRAGAALPAPWLRPPFTELFRTEIGRPPDRKWMLPGRVGRLRMLSHPSLPRQVEAMNQLAARRDVEFRHPLLDHRLIEFALSLPTDQTFRASQRKIILRNAMRGLLPDKVLDRWTKIYPTAILHRGLREREQAKVWPLMSHMRAAEMGFVDERKLRGAYQDYLDGKTEDTLFWHTLTLEDWLRRWF